MRFCCSLHTLFCGPLLLTAAFCFCFPLPVSVFTSRLWRVLLPVSIAPPPPPMPQLTPQIPLTGFVARVQENSKCGTQLLQRVEPTLSLSLSLLACMAGQLDSWCYCLESSVHSSRTWDANSILRPRGYMELRSTFSVFGLLKDCCLGMSLTRSIFGSMAVIRMCVCCTHLCLFSFPEADQIYLSFSLSLFLPFFLSSFHSFP